MSERNSRDLDEALGRLRQAVLGNEVQSLTFQSRSAPSANNFDKHAGAQRIASGEQQREDDLDHSTQKQPPLAQPRVLLRETDSSNDIGPIDPQQGAPVRSTYDKPRAQPSLERGASGVETASRNTEIDVYSDGFFAKLRRRIRAVFR